MRERLPLIVSITALLVAVLGSTPLGTAAYHAVVPRNSVGTLQLKRNAVTSAKIAPNAIRTGQLVDGSLLSADFKAGQVPQGPKGDKGEKGDKGDKGDPATKLWATVPPDGTIKGSKGVAGTTHVSTGIYRVRFDQDPSKCAIFAQPILLSAKIGWALESEPNNVIRVDIFTTTPVNIDSAFSVAVFC